MNASRCGNKEMNEMMMKMMQSVCCGLKDKWLMRWRRAEPRWVFAGPAVGAPVEDQHLGKGAGRREVSGHFTCPHQLTGPDSCPSVVPPARVCLVMI